MDKQEAADQYLDSVIIDLSKKLTAAETRVQQLELALSILASTNPPKLWPEYVRNDVFAILGIETDDSRS